MVGWTRLQADAHKSAVFSRPLGLTELSLYWEAATDRATDMLQTVTVETSIPQAAQFFSAENVKRTWLAVKRLHPMIGAYIHEENPLSVHFVVDEERLSSLALDEVVFGSLTSEQDEQTLADRILNDPHSLSNEMIVRLLIFSLPRHHGSLSVRHRVCFNGAHYVYDGLSQGIVMRAFFDILVQEQVPDLYIPRNDLQSCLAPLSAMEDLYPALRYSVSRQRWRVAIAKVIYSNREAALQGGFTLFRNKIYPAPAVSRALRVVLSKDLSKKILDSCRQASLTLGQVLPVLAQVAHARILHKLRSEGRVSPQDWDHQIRQPMHMTGPCSLRKYLDEELTRNNGIGRVCVAISNFRITLPFLPVSRSSHPEIVPELNALLSKARFFHRCHGVRKQMVSFLTHPLLTEFTSLLRPARIAKAREGVLNSRRESQMELLGKTPESADPISNFEGGPAPPHQYGQYILANACSTVGNTTLHSEYPLKRAPSRMKAPSIRVISAYGDMRCRPAEFYLTAWGYSGQIHLLLLCDVRVYGETLAIQWLKEVGHAAEWYLGDGNVKASKL